VRLRITVRGSLSVCSCSVACPKDWIKSGRDGPCIGPVAGSFSTGRSDELFEALATLCAGKVVSATVVRQRLEYASLPIVSFATVASAGCYEAHVRSRANIRGIGQFLEGL
jgi:hypothetical protein